MEDIRRSFTFDADRDTETAEIEGRLTLIDEASDGTVDEVTNDAGTWRRGEPGVEALFAEADRKFARVRGHLRIDGYLEDWNALTPLERAQAGVLDVRD